MHIQPTRPSGRSLLELLMVLVIIALLATLAFPTVGYFRAKAAYVGCVSNLKALHGGFASYLSDNQMIWPQLPEGLKLGEGGSSQKAEWWFNQLQPYGITKKTWVCPAADADVQKVTETEGYYTSTYTVTRFDEQPNRAYQWISQPWVIESGDMHGVGKGPNVLFPDGRIERGMSVMISQ